MLQFFRTHPVTDPVLGELVRSRFYWRGSIVLGGREFPLVLGGSRSGPAAEATGIAHALPGMWSAARELLQRAIFDHYLPYAEAGPPWLSSEPPPVISAPDGVWEYVQIQSISVTRWNAYFNRAFVAEIALSVHWDEEHTLGARFINGQFTELNGSIVPVG
jgi:hypothetical protein